MLDLVDDFSDFLRTPVEGERIEYQHLEGVVVKALPEDPDSKDKVAQAEIEVKPHAANGAAPADTAPVRMTAPVSELKYAIT